MSEATKADINRAIALLISLVVLLATVHVLNMLFDYSLNQRGIIPRDVSSLPNIVLAPWLHSNLSHLLNNLAGLVILSGVCLLRSIRFYLAASVFVILIGGLLVWLFARSAIHVGASGWIFGLWGVSLASAWFERSFLTIALACLVMLFYGGMVYGLLPNNATVSFESHLAGAAAGVLFAWLSARFNWVTGEGGELP